MGTHLVDGLETFHELKRLISSITETIHKRERENRKSRRFSRKLVKNNSSLKVYSPLSRSQILSYNS